MKNSNRRSVWLSYAKTIALSVLLALLINHTLIVNAHVPSSSMENTIMTGDRIIGFRLFYSFSEPERGDIILFRFPDDPSQTLIKRIIGLPGETIRIRNGKVYINDSEIPLIEPYLTGQPKGSFGPFEIPDAMYFVMGDNRGDSYDSRYWANPFVSKKEIIGKALFSYYPDLHAVS